MYKIKGADQKEYGPVTADQIRQWIRENRLNRASMAESVDNPGWKTLGEFPEFADAFPAAAVPGSGQFQSSVPPGGSTAVVADPIAAAAQLKAPAIVLIVFAVLGMLLGIGTPFTKKPMMDGFIRIIEQSGAQLPPDALKQMENTRDEGFTLKDGFGMAIGLVSNVVMLVGALKMMKLQSWGLALTAAILVMLPCGSCCCCIGIGIGIWAIILLNKPEIKGAFR
jgi:hypothetical protein